MPLPDQISIQLRELLKECTAFVQAGSSKGTGFFVDGRLLLTCAHVVEGEDTVTVTPFNRAPRPGTVVERLPVEEGDLALVEVDEVADEVAPQPAVLLDSYVADGTVAEAVGYPTDEVDPRTGLQPLRYQATPRRADADEVLGIILAGSQVTGGLSGAPVLNMDTGAVVGVVRYTKNDSNALGGGAVPIAAALKAFERVAKLHVVPPGASVRWITTLGERGLRALGRERQGSSVCFDIRLAGTPACWSVQAGTAPVLLDVGKLDERVSNALFHWARHRRVRERSDLRVLGRFLSAALLYDTIGTELATRRSGASELLVRLAFDGDCDLGDVPWEFATTSPAEDASFLGTDERLSLVRIVPGGPSRMPDPGPRARVLGLIVQPTDFLGSHPPVMVAGTQVPWPHRDSLEETLRQAVTGQKVVAAGDRGLEFFPSIHPTFSDRLGEDHDATYDVVHYVGYGRQSSDGDQLAFSDGFDGLSFTRVADFLQAAARLRPKLIVVEMATLPPDKDWRPMSRSAFVDSLPSPVAAIVATRFPVHPREQAVFERGFYDALRKGTSVELAVQAGRRNLSDIHPIDDWTSFGAFAVYTGTVGGLQLLERPERQEGEQRLTGSRRAPDRAAPQTRTEARTDEFSG